MLTPFMNEAINLFQSPTEVEEMKRAIAFVNSNLGKEYDLIVGGERVKTQKKLKSINPADKSELVGVVNLASQELAERAISIAYDTYESLWRNFDPYARARILLKAAAIMRKRKFELSAWMVVEIGKSWIEAVADTAEAIDFLEFYARAMMGYAGAQKVEAFPGEENSFYWMPLGVIVVIPPWNFPNAILTGMTAAALVTGNTVVLKPASITPIIAAKVMEIFEEAGLPKGVLNYLPGSGGEVGDYIVEHPKTRMIAFTGSKEVGIRINERAAKVVKGQKWLKRVIAEMGGKDTMVVDEDVDLDAAARDIVAGAFGFQGQKCSANSRVVAMESVSEKLVAKVKELSEKLKIGDPRERENTLGPVSSESAFDSIMRYIEIGKKEATLVSGGEALSPEKGYFIKPTIFKNVKPSAVISQEEIFGPVISFLKAKSFKEAIAIANDTEYGLTGGVYSNNREHLEYARREFFVGNLYFNRKITGALVGVQPFGGFNMSGTDSKAGGKEYLTLFMQAKTVTERF
ncbi:MAG: L-glutamate gamma-semialdehyde dehydrogenase [Myxococcota bacterium]